MEYQTADELLGFVERELDSLEYFVDSYLTAVAGFYEHNIDFDDPIIPDYIGREVNRTEVESIAEQSAVVYLALDDFDYQIAEEINEGISDNRHYSYEAQNITGRTLKKHLEDEKDRIAESRKSLNRMTRRISWNPKFNVDTFKSEQEFRDQFDFTQLTISETVFRPDAFLPEKF